MFNHTYPRELFVLRRFRLGENRHETSLIFPIINPITRVAVSNEGNRQGRRRKTVNRPMQFRCVDRVYFRIESGGRTSVLFALQRNCDGKYSALDHSVVHYSAAAYTYNAEERSSLVFHPRDFSPGYNFGSETAPRII